MPLYYSSNCILEYAPPPELIGGLVSEGTVNFIYGAPASGKSIFAIHLAACLAKGRENYFEHECRKSEVLYIAQEDLQGVQEKTAAISLEQLLLITEDMFGILYEPNLGLKPHAIEQTIHEVEFSFQDMYDQHFSLHLSDIGHDLPKVLIIDTWAAMTSGIDENSSKDVSNALQGLKLLRDKLNCTIFVVHHSGKDFSKGLRGHSAMHAFADNVWRISQQKNMHVVEVLKAKHHLDGTKFGFMIGQREVTFQNGVTTKQLPFCDPLQAESVKQVTSISKTEWLVYAQLKEMNDNGIEGVSRRQLSDALMGVNGFSNIDENRKKTVDRSTSSLLKSCLIIEENGILSINQDNVPTANDNISANNGTDRDTPL